MTTMTDLVRSLSQAPQVFDYGAERFNAAALSAVKMQLAIDASGHIPVAAEPVEHLEAAA